MEGSSGLSSSIADIQGDSIFSAFCKVTDRNQLPQDLQELLPGMYEPLPTDYNLPPLPPWFDPEKARNGQAFALKYMFGVNYSQVLSLLFLFSSVEGMVPLIFTEKSHTPPLANERYLSTVLRVKSWYETEVWRSESEGYKNLKMVRALHLNVSNQLNVMAPDQVRQNSNLDHKLKQTNSSMLCPLLSILRADFEKNNDPAYLVHAEKTDRIYLNQLEMGFTQFGFYGLMLVFPEKFGAENATPEEMESFVHLWRFIGYMLGIKDEYNMCKGSLVEARQRVQHLMEYFLKPMLLNVNKEWEHMSRVALQGIGEFTKFTIPFEAAISYLCWVLEISTPNLLNYIGWKEQMLFKLTKLVMTKSHNVPWFANLANYTLKRNIETAEMEMKKQMANDQKMKGKKSDRGE